MKNISIERLVFWGFMIIAVAFALLGGIAWQSAVKSDEAFSQEIHTHQVLATVGKIIFNLTRAETAQRGYAIYGTNDYLESRDESLLDVIQSVAQSERLMVAPAQQEQLHQLKKLIALRMEIFRREQQKIHNTSGQVVVAGFGTSLSIMDQIHHAIGRIAEMENERLHERQAEIAFQHKVAYVSFVLLGVALSLLLVFMFLRIRRAMSMARDEEALFKNAKLEEASRMKSEFMAHMSHELRTPINAIMGFSELLKDGQLGKLTKAQTEYVSDIYSSGQHLLALVNNILDLSKIEAGKMKLDLEQVDISELLDSCTSIIKEKAASQRLIVDVRPELGDVHVDTLKAKQILYNLLSNAAKFTPDGGKLKLRARRVQRSEVGRVSGYWPSRTFPLAENEFMEFVEISVADSGIGIPPDGLERLFQPYSRIDSGTARKFEGTGLGLMLVKHLAELHGGTVAVESTEGQGSRFMVWLPLRMEVEATVAPEELLPRQAVPEAMRKTRRIRAGTEIGLMQQRTFVNA